jgi:hypothetical protein
MGPAGEGFAVTAQAEARQAGNLKLKPIQL